jgi:hypothetical protein
MASSLDVIAVCLHSMAVKNGSLQEDKELAPDDDRPTHDMGGNEINYD